MTKKRRRDERTGRHAVKRFAGTKVSLAAGDSRASGSHPLPLHGAANTWVKLQRHIRAPTFLGARTWLWVPLALGTALRAYQLDSVLDSDTLRDALLLDSALYREMAQLWTAGDWLMGDEALQLGPLYPAILGVLAGVWGWSNENVFMLQSIVGVGTIGLVTLLSRRLCGRLGAMLSGIAYAAYAPPMLLEAKIQAEPFALFATMLSIYLWLHSRRYPWGAPLSGASMGAACLLRPDLLLAIPLVVTWSLVGVKRRRAASVARKVAVWGFAAVAVVGVATARNLVVTGEAIPISAQAGVTFYQGNNARATGSYSMPEGFGANKEEQADRARSRAEQEAGRPLTATEVSSFWFAKGTNYLLSDPAAAFALFGSKLHWWLSSAELSGEYTLAVGRCLVPALSLAVTPFGLLIACAILGFPPLSVARKRVAWLYLQFVLAGFLTGMLFFVSARYRLIAAACLATFVGPAAESLLRREWLGSGRLRAATALAALAVSFTTSDSALRYQAAGELYNLGGFHYENGRWKDAITFYVSAREISPNHSRLLFNLAHAHAMNRDYAAAAQSLERLLVIHPGDEEARAFFERYKARATDTPTQHQPVCEL